MFSVALVGTGSFAQEHLKVLRQIPDVDVRYIVGSDRARTEAMAALVPGAIASTSLDTVLRDPALHAVDICNRTPQHAPAAIAATRAGKHVHVDKPAALSVADFDEMTASARAGGVSLMVGQTVRFQPIISRIRNSIDRGEIGTPRMLHVSWYTGHVWPGGWRGWQLDVEKSGGHPVHNGTHILDLAVWLMGSEPVEVMTRSFSTFAAEMPMPDSFTMIVRFANGSLATLELCYALRERGDALRRIVVAGEKGTLKHSTEDDPGLSAPGIKPPPASTLEALDLQLNHWVRAATGREDFIVHAHEARATLAAAIAAQESLLSGLPVRIGSGGANRG